MIQQLIYGLKVIQCLLQGSPNANIVNGTPYVVGGDMNDRSLNVVESYDPIAIDGPPTHRCPHLGTMLLLRW